VPPEEHFPTFLMTVVSLSSRVGQSVKYSQCRRMRQCMGVVVLASVAISDLVIFYSVCVLSEAACNIA
jgi:hypothetical protein